MIYGSGGGSDYRGMRHIVKIGSKAAFIGPRVERELQLKKLHKRAPRVLATNLEPEEIPEQPLEPRRSQRVRKPVERLNL